jgi:hypothetical protein
VAVDDTLGVARRAARVTHGRRRAFVGPGVGEVEAVVLGGEEFLVGQHVAAEGGSVGFSHDDELLHRLQFAGHPGQQGDEAGIDQDHAVFGVVGDVRELLGEEPQVERVQHGAH